MIYFNTHNFSTSNYSTCTLISFAFFIFFLIHFFFQDLLLSMAKHYLPTSEPLITLVHFILFFQSFPIKNSNHAFKSMFIHLLAVLMNRFMLLKNIQIASYSKQIYTSHPSHSFLSLQMAHLLPYASLSHLYAFISFMLSKSIFFFSWIIFRMLKFFPKIPSYFFHYNHSLECNMQLKDSYLQSHSQQAR